MNIEVNLDSAALRATLAQKQAALQDKTALHEAMAAGVEAEISEHLLKLNSRSPNTGFYGKAARNTLASANDERGLVSIQQRGIALRYYGGRVLPKEQKNLAIPTSNVPLAGTEGRKGPREVGPLAFIPARRGGPSVTTGYLVEGEEKTITRGPRKGGKRIVPKEGGKLMYVLRGWTDHDADPSVLPTTAVMLTAATTAVGYLLESYGNGGPA